LADFLGATAYPDFHRLLGQKPDAVWVTTPNTLHTEAVLDALAAGAHVFSEKPMATTLPEAKRIAAAVKKAGRIYQLGFNRRFAPVYVRLYELIAEKHIHPHSLHVKMNRGELMHPSWVGDPKVTGGFLYESTVTCSTCSAGSSATSARCSRSARRASIQKWMTSPSS